MAVNDKLTPIKACKFAFCMGSKRKSLAKLSTVRGSMIGLGEKVPKSSGGRGSCVALGLDVGGVIV